MIKLKYYFSPMAKPTFSIIGCGRIGLFFGKLLSSHVTLLSLISKSSQSVIKGAEFLGLKSEAIQNLKSSDFYLLAVPENAIEECAIQLAETGVIKEGQIVFHASGAYSSDLLKSLKHQGAFVASLHPDLSVADPSFIPSSFYATLEGDAEAKTALRKLFSFYPIAFLDLLAEDKLIYHTSLVLVANFSLALIDLAEKLLASTQLEDVELLLASLQANALLTIQQKGLKKALSGPLSRGAADLVAKQLNLMKSLHPHYGEIYRLLSLELLEICEEAKLLSPSEGIKLKEILK